MFSSVSNQVGKPVHFKKVGGRIVKSVENLCGKARILESTEQIKRLKGCLLIFV